MKWIYLIKAELEGVEYYKIGVTGRLPETRLKELQTGNALSLELIHIFKTHFGTLLEARLHRNYAESNENGEWFALKTDEVGNFLDTCQRIENNFKYISENNTYMDDKKWKKF